MIDRCYGGLEPNYINCNVCEEWHNFQNFAEWWHKEPFSGKKGFNLDKDLLKKGNTLYSPEFCSFVPQEVNKLVLNVRKSRGEFPLGVSFSRQQGKYVAQLCVDSRPIFLGYYDKSDEAFLAYKSAKEARIKDVAERYKHLIKESVYENLMAWEIYEDD